MPTPHGGLSHVKAYAFDAYGTLFDVHAAMRHHRAAMGADAEAFSALWRVKQLEYTWTRTLMDRYVDFWTLTQEALDFCFVRFPQVSRTLRQPLLDAYESLDAYDDAAPALKALAHGGKRLAIFTNGTRAMAKAAATSSGIAAAFEEIVSVDDIRQFKTNPAAYALLHDALGLPLGEIALVSSNRWDAAGGSAFGMPAFWVNRTGQPDEYLDLAPVAVISSLMELKA